MIFNKSELRIYESYGIKLTDEVLGKLEDAAKDRKELLLTIDASHYGMLNGNGVYYRHDTVKNNIHSFIYPDPKPMIERHKPKTSDKFGHIVAADYKLTKFYDQLNKEWQLEGLNTSEYLDLCKDVLMPLQRRNRDYNGLAYVQVMGKLKHRDAIDKVLKKEFLNVSIGADPKKLICSECGQDQVHRICDHYSDKGNGIFMLAEELEYEELSFVPRGADPYGRVIQIHDEDIKLIDAHVDVIDYNDFYKITENKTIVCVNNICKICDQEEEMAKRKEEQKVVSVTYTEEFTAEKLKELKINDEQVTDEVIASLGLKDELVDSDFAIVQKTDEGLKRRFALTDEVSVKLAAQLIDQAQDLTDSELAKAKKSIAKAAKKFGIECACKDEKQAEPEKVDEQTIEANTMAEMTIEGVTAMLADMLKEEYSKLQDGAENPLTVVLTKLADAGSVAEFVQAQLEAEGKEAVDKTANAELAASVQALKDELAETKEDLELLDEQNRDLNYQIREAKVDEILALKDIAEGELETEKKRLFKLSYETLKEVASELKKSASKTKDLVINNKEVKTITDPTHIADEQGETEEEKAAKLADEQKPLTRRELELALSAHFRSNR